MQVRTRWHMVAIAVLVLATVGCPGGDDTATQQPVDQRARDSAIAESGLPGAGGVRRALDVADSAAARQARIDSISGGN